MVAVLATVAPKQVINMETSTEIVHLEAVDMKAMEARAKAAVDLAHKVVLMDPTLPRIVMVVTELLWTTPPIKSHQANMEALEEDGMMCVMLREGNLNL